VNGFVYRRLLEEDMDQLRALHAALFPLSYTDQFYSELSRNYCTSLVVVSARTPSLLLGFATARCEVHHSLCGGSSLTAYLMTIGVRQDMQRHGLGGELLERIMVLLFEQGAQSLSLHVLASNRTAVGFYRSHGFTVLERLRGHYLIEELLYDALLMQIDNPQIVDSHRNSDASLLLSVGKYLSSVWRFFVG